MKKEQILDHDHIIVERGEKLRIEVGGQAFYVTHNEDGTTRLDCCCATFTKITDSFDEDKEWRKNPIYYDKTTADEIKEYIEENPLGYADEGFEIELEDKYLKVPLPDCNTQWSLAAWRWTEDFCKHFRDMPYPVHYDGLDHANFIYIELEDIL
jgi:hypothetical protein